MVIEKVVCHMRVRKTPIREGALPYVQGVINAAK